MTEQPIPAAMLDAATEAICRLHGWITPMVRAALGCPGNILSPERREQWERFSDYAKPPSKPLACLISLGRTVD